MATVSIYGPMETNMMAIGSIIRRRDSANLNLEVVLIMKDTGLKIKLMVMVFIPIVMATCIKGIGRRINRMGMERRHYWMVPIIKDNSQMDGNMGKGSRHGLIIQSTMVSGLRIKLLDEGPLNGLMDESVLVNG